MRNNLFFPAAFAAVLALACAESEPARDLVVLRGETMGTTWVVKVASDEPDETAQRELAKGIAGELDAVDRAMSTYREDSELSRFNRHRETGPFRLSDETFSVVAQALALARASGGAFDVTVGPLVAAWGFGAGGDGEGTPPSAEELDRLRESVGFYHLTLATESRSLIKAAAELEIDLSGIAKGHGVDRVARYLDGAGITDYLVEIGGELRARGGNERGRPWRVGIERPGSGPRQTAHRIVALENRAMATSGDYRSYRELNGERVSHIIDPRSGRPIRHRLASATVIADDCAFADGWATALMVLGPEEGMRQAEEQSLAALFLVRADDGFEERPSAAFQALIDRAG